MNSSRDWMRSSTKTLADRLAGPWSHCGAATQLSVHYRTRFLGKLVPDLIVDGTIIVDPKVVSAFNDTHIARMLGYLNITGLEVAVLLNFKESTLAWKRVIRGGQEENRGLHG